MMIWEKAKKEESNIPLFGIKYATITIEELIQM